MSKRSQFFDENENELECYINDKGKLYITVGQSGVNWLYGGSIALNKKEALELIKVLTELQSGMEE